MVECGQRPAKAVTGETFQVSATVFRDGHGIIAAAAVLRDPAGNRGPLVPMTELAPGTDRYGADVTIGDQTGTWRFHVEAWADPIASWHHDAAIKIPGGQDVELMLTEGALLFARAARRIPQPPGAARPAAARRAPARAPVRAPGGPARSRRPRPAGSRPRAPSCRHPLPPRALRLHPAQDARPSFSRHVAFT